MIFFIKYKLLSLKWGVMQHFLIYLA